MDRNYPITEFDIQTVPWLIQLAKAALPFFDIHIQRQMALMIRFYEFRATMDFFKNEPRHSGGASFSIEYIKELVSNADFQKCVEPYCPAGIFEMIKNYKMLSDMSGFVKNAEQAADILNKNHADNMSDIFSMMQGMSGSCGMTNANSACMCLNSAQQAMYDEYMKQLDNIL